MWVLSILQIYATNLIQNQKSLFEKYQVYSCMKIIFIKCDGKQDI